MVKRLAVLTALAILLPRLGSAATLGELEAWCAPADKGGRPSLCEGYLDANLELLASPDPASNGGTRVCVPAQEDRARIVGLMRDYTHRHHEARSQDSVMGPGEGGYVEVQPAERPNGSAGCIPRRRATLKAARAWRGVA